MTICSAGVKIIGYITNSVGVYMKRLLKLLTLTLIALCCAFSFLACDNGDGGNDDKGLLCKKFIGEDFYTVYKYVDEGEGVTTLDIGAEVKEKYGNDAVVGRIKTNAFAGNDTLLEIIVPDTVTEINAGAFSTMRRLKKITLPFVGKTANADAYIGETADSETKSVNEERTFGYVFSSEAYDFGGKITVNYGAGTKDFYIPASLVEVTIAPKEDYKIPAYAFNGVNQVNKINLTNKVVEIGEYAFENALSIHSFAIPETVTKIHKGAFKGTANLKTVTMAGNALTEIGDEAFKNSGVENIVLPASVVSLGEHCFSASKLADITFSSSLANIGAYAFYNCESLQIVTFTGTAKINVQSAAFRLCEKLNADATFKAHFEIKGANVFDN